MEVTVFITYRGVLSMTMIAEPLMYCTLMITQAQSHIKLIVVLLPQGITRLHRFVSVWARDLRVFHLLAVHRFRHPSTRPRQIPHPFTHLRQLRFLPTPLLLTRLRQNPLLLTRLRQNPLLLTRLRQIPLLLTALHPLPIRRLHPPQ